MQLLVMMTGENKNEHSLLWQVHSASPRIHTSPFLTHPAINHEN
jgi:hypothetical protein